MAQEPRPGGGPPPTYMLTHEQFTALVGQRGGLTDRQVDRLVDALRGRGDIIASLRELTPEQKRINAAINRVGARMGIDDYRDLLPRVPRRNGCIGVVPPPSTASIRIFYTRGVVEVVPADASSRSLPLPSVIGQSDVVEGLDFLNADGHVIASAGLERPAAMGEAQCSHDSSAT
jgi:hypothetical protein